jgi:hypothetical protein
MQNRTYSLVAGIALLLVAIVFFIMPGLLDYDAFIPVIVGVVAFISGLGILLLGFGQGRQAG